MPEPIWMPALRYLAGGQSYGVNVPGVATDALREIVWLQAEIDRLETGHCKDCCCAQSWVALGITERTGLSIPEEIENLRSEIKRLQAVVDDRNEAIGVFQEVVERLQDKVARLDTLLHRGLGKGM